MRIICYALAIICLTLFAHIESGQARAKYTFKIASLAPEGSVWVNQFEKFADEVKEKSGGNIAFRIYSGGVMGDDQAMYRKMRVGQLHGGGFTMTGISSIVPDFRVLSIPFFFKSYEEVDAVRNGMVPFFKKKFAEKGLEMIAMTEVGFIYTMSTRPVHSIAELKQATSWIPAGDPLAATFLENIGITPVQLGIPDVLSSLQTGLVNTVYNSLYGSIVMQWFTKAKYITDTPFGYAYGVVLLDKRKFAKLPPEYAKLIHQAAANHFSVLIDETRKSNKESREVMKKRGVQFISSEKVSVAELEQQREKTVTQLKGKSFSNESYQIATKLLNDFRNNKQ